jgi:hypothetical protein
MIVIRMIDSNTSVASITILSRLAKKLVADALRASETLTEGEK